MPFKFNQKLWDIGRKIEDDTLPLINKYYGCDFKRNDNDIFDILDFKDDEKKIVVEIKGRRCSSRQYEDTIITASKITEGFMKIDEGYEVYFVFVFTDKTMEIELKEDADFKVKFTGTNCIKHYCIPVSELKEIEIDDENNISE
tara:strand:+ start:11228 stop:11659 length:432 start_codon:yes stop_codon:yes gene_type:complete